MSSHNTPQMRQWTGDFGRAYTDRSIFSDEKEFNQLYIDRFGRTRDDLCRDWLADISKSAKILEIGSNVGHQLRSLRNIGFQHLYGIEIQRYCVDRAKELTPGVDIIEGSAFDIPFKDGFFDLVFTNNVLIHFKPNDLGAIFDEMHRVTRRYLWGFEYYAPSVTEIIYRGNTDLLWKADYANLILERFADMRLRRTETYACNDEPEILDKAYLLEKTAR